MDTKLCNITKDGSISEDFFCIELKLCTVVAITTKFHDISHCDISMATKLAPGPLHLKDKIRVFLLQEELFALVVYSVGVS